MGFSTMTASGWFLCCSRIAFTASRFWFVRCGAGRYPGVMLSNQSKNWSFTFCGGGGATANARPLGDHDTPLHVVASAKALAHTSFFSDENDDAFVPCAVDIHSTERIGPSKRISAQFPRARYILERAWRGRAQRR